jgi:hypothetical protein
MTRQWIDVEALLCDFIGTVPGVKTTATKTPAAPSGFTDDNTPFVQVRRIGGTDDRITDRARVDVDVYATEEQAHDISELIRQALRRLAGTVYNGQKVDRITTEVAPCYFDFVNTALQRYIATYVVETRLVTSGDPE